MGIKVEQFEGVIPRTPPANLPPSAATVAQNCDFAYGELRNTRDNFVIKSMANAARSIYTDNGLTFYSWGEDVNAVRSPLARDQFDRLYFTTESDFRVAARSGMRTNGGEPSSSYRVGVPAPTLAPKLEVAEITNLASATITATFHYEFAGTKYQEQVISLGVVTALSHWTFTPPVKDVWVAPAPTRNPTTGEYNPYPTAPANKTPSTAYPVVRLVAKMPDSKETLIDVYTSNSTMSVPGMWALELVQGTVATSMALKLKPTNQESDKETRAYVYTYVNTYGEEGPPSPPATISLLTTMAVKMTLTRDTGLSGYAPIKEMRIYRTPTNSTVASYFYTTAVQVLGAGGSQFIVPDTVTAAGLNEPLSSMDCYPPDPSLRGVISLPNGILMAWRDNELHFSEAYRPWSWPPQYVKTFPDVAIVGAHAYGSAALVITTGRPFLISGVSPDAMTDNHLNVAQAGVSKHAIADVGGVMLYASHDGLVAVAGGSANMNLSNMYFTRDVWRDKYGPGLASMRFAVWDGRLVVYSSNNSFVPFMLGLDEAKGAMTDLPGLQAACSFTSQLSDQCYLMQGYNLIQFMGGSDATATWESREFHGPRPTNFGCAQVDCTGLWSVSIYAGIQATPTSVPVFQLKHTQSNLNGYVTFNLPSGFTSDRWKVAITGQGAFKGLRMAENQKALKVL